MDSVLSCNISGAIPHRGGLFDSNGLFDILSDTECNGSEDKLIDCGVININSDCSTREDAVVFCQGN